MNTQQAIDRVCELAQRHMNTERILTARKRTGAVLGWQDADYIPLQFGAKVPELAELPEYDWREQWYDPAKSFVTQMRAVVSSLAGGGDNIPGVRADTGVINGPCLFGAEFDVPTHTKPVVTKYVPKEMLESFTLPDDIRGLGITQRVVEHMEHHKAVLAAHGLGGWVSVYHCDTQGPFDIAEQTRGHDLFTDMFECPEFVHHLMEQATKAYIALSLLCKKIEGEGETRGNAKGCWMEKGGVRLCDDSGILLSVKGWEEFVLPYHTKALDRFGGGWIHYCGGVPGGGRAEGLHLHDSYAKIPCLRGFNFTTGGDWFAEVKKMIDHRVNYIGGLPRGKEEPLESFFRRVLALCPGRKGLILGSGPRTPEEAAGFMDLWHRLQDEMM